MLSYMYNNKKNTNNTKNTFTIKYKELHNITTPGASFIWHLAFSMFFPLNVLLESKIILLCSKCVKLCDISTALYIDHNDDIYTSFN